MKKTIDYWLILIGICFLVIGIFLNIKFLNLIGFISSLIGIYFKYFNKSSCHQEQQSIKNNSIITIENDAYIPIVKEKKFKYASANNVFVLKDLWEDFKKKMLSNFNEEYSFYENNCCPNCGCVLKTKTTSTRNCPECKKHFFLKTDNANKKKLLISDEKYLIYLKLEDKKKDILFYEKILQTINSIYPEYMKEFYKQKKEYDKRQIEHKSFATDPGRDYVWTFCDWLINKIDTEAYKEYGNALKLPFQEKVLKCDMIVMRIKHAGNILRLMAELCEYKNDDEVLLQMIVHLLYRNVVIAYLPYFHWNDRPFSELNFYSDIYTMVMSLVDDYMATYNININDFKDKFINCKMHSYIFNTLVPVSAEEAWPSIQESYYEYVKLKANKK